MEHMHLIGSAAWGFRALELPEQLALAKKYGMTFHELGIANADTDLPLDADSLRLDRVRQLYARHGIRLCCAATGNDFTGPDAPEQLQKVLRVIELCACLGVERLRVFAGFTPLAEMTGEAWRTMLACLKEAAGAAKRRGIVLCVETHGAVEPLLDGVRHIRSATTQLSDVLRIVRETGAAVVFDPANLHAVGETDLEAFLEAVKPHLGYIHLKDFQKGSGGQLYPCAMGQGGIRWTELARKMAEAGVPMLFEYENPQDLEAGLEKCISFWKEV